MFPAERPVVLHDRMDVIGLVHYLRDEGRTRPVAVLTVERGKYAPYVDAVKLRSKVGGGVDVVTIANDELTQAMSQQLADKRAGVYRGACRVYPPGTQWERDPFSAPLRFARNSQEIADLPRDLALDVKNARTQASKPPRPARPEVLETLAARDARAGSRVPVLPPPMRDVATRDDAEQLVRFLRSGARLAPAVVISRAVGASEAYADVEELEGDLEGLAAVFEISTLDASWAFTDAMRDGCQVYGGAGRVYPVGTGWEQDPYVSPLHFAHSRADRAGITRALVGDVMRMASSGTMTVNAPSGRPERVTGEVTGVIAERGMVKLDDQEFGVLWPELIEPDVPAERLFAQGMRIEGLFDPDSRRIDVRAMRRDGKEALGGYRPGDTVLVQVIGVTSEACTVMLFPGVTATVTAGDVAQDATDLHDLVTEGEVLAALLVAVDPSGEWLLSVAEAGEATEAVPAPSILAGGPAWLVAPEPVVPASDLEPESQLEPVSSLPAEQQTTEPRATPVVTPLDEAHRREKAQLVFELEQERRANARLQHDLQSARAHLRKAKMRKGGGETGAPDDSRLFEDPAQQLDFEIRLAWARMTLPSEKRDLPLKKWTYGPQFLDTLHELEGISREKVVEVIVHVLTGRDAELASRELHQLRSGLGANDVPLVRERGELCWRVSLQTNTPAARRLHYWSCAEGSVELSSVRVHDEFRP